MARIPRRQCPTASPDRVRWWNDEHECPDVRGHLWVDGALHVYCKRCGFIACCEGALPEQPAKPVSKITKASTKADSLALRDGNRCYYCGTGFDHSDPGYTVTGLARTIDHRVPRVAGGTNDPSNLVLACFWCNHVKGDRTVEEFESDPRLHERRICMLRKPLRQLTA